jgi:hypothetical protein
MAMAGTVEQTQTCILVLGMNRSGTSALTSMLSLLGATLPRDLNKGTPSDIVDYWEPLPLVECHNEMLWVIGSRWNDWRPFRPDNLPAGSFDNFKGKIAGLVETQF